MQPDRLALDGRLEFRPRVAMMTYSATPSLSSDQLEIQSLPESKFFLTWSYRQGCRLMVDRAGFSPSTQMVWACNKAGIVAWPTLRIRKSASRRMVGRFTEVDSLVVPDQVDGRT